MLNEKFPQMLLEPKKTKNMWGLDFTLRGRQRTSLGFWKQSSSAGIRGSWSHAYLMAERGYQTVGVFLTMTGEAPELCHIILITHISRQVFWKWLLKGQEEKPEVENKELALIWQCDMNSVKQWELPKCLFATGIVQVAPSAGGRTPLAGGDKE